MTHVPERPMPLDSDVTTTGEPQVPAAVVDSARAADRVLYGPDGDVIIRIEDRKQIGFRR